NWTTITSGATRTLPLYSVTATGQNFWTVSNDLTVTCTYNGSTWSTLRLGTGNEIFYGKYSAIVPKITTRNIFQMGVKDNTTAISPFYYSQNDGSSYNSESQFNSLNGGATNVEGLVVDPGRSTKVYAYGRLQDGSGAYHPFYHSDNHGDPGTWVTTQASFTSRPILTLSPKGNSASPPYNSQTIYAGAARGGNDAGLWRTRDAGANWAQVSTSTIRIDTQVNATAWNPINVPDIAYAGTFRGLYWSYNPNAADDEVLFYKRWPTGDIDTAVKRILIDPRFTHSSHNSANVFWVASNNMIYRCENGGTSPVTVNGNLPSGIVLNDIRSDPSDTTRIYIATDRGIYKSHLVVPPNLTSPANGATNILDCITSTEPLKFQWSTVGGATSYGFQLDDNSDFSSPLVNTTTSSNQYSHDSNLVCEIQYYWRVRSIDGFGNSPWSGSRSFTTSACNLPQLAAPTLVSPPNGSTGHEKCLTLRWNAVSGAIKYRVEVIGYKTTHVSDTSYWDCYSSNTWYNWKVKAINCNYANPFSETWSFKIRDYGITSLDSQKTQSQVDIEEIDIPSKFELKQNYPNPFNPLTIINYQLPIDNWVTLKVYDVLGREIATLIDEFQVSGFKSVKFDASKISSGIYFCRLTCGKFSDIKKIHVTK
ncbi:MAG: T9SS type A sorting domain-containing protein, partial [Bacteroidota bacterium]|nr:T9SS type A sorting domain-containing protein [Bacteroidota bacterium]